MTTDTRLRSDEGSQLADAARNVADQATQTVEARASTTMDQVATAVEEVAQAIRRASNELRQEQPQVASVAETAATQVERFADYLESHEPRDVFDAVEDAARRQPALVIGGGIAIGLLLGRLLRSAAPIDQPSGNGSTYGRTRTTMRSMSPSFDRGSTGYRTGRSSDNGDAGSSIVAGTSVVEPGSTVESGTSRRSTR
jgi:ElaB/YqjD/DUF883 family membrane-anchored ribosome-binding protein